MELNFIHDARQAEYFQPGEVGEVCCRLIMKDGEPSVTCVAYQTKVLTDQERVVLSALRDRLAATIFGLKYNGGKKKGDDEE